MRKRKTNFKICPEASASINDQGMVVLDGRGGRLFQSNLVGALIWRGVETQASLEAIAEVICQRYEIAAEAARNHIDRFLAELKRHNLILIGDAA